MKVEDKSVVVTGGASGIGRALARRFAAEGARGLAVVDLDGEGAERVAEEVGGLGLRADVSREREVQEVVRRAEERFGPTDLFCSNAGIAIHGTEATPDEEWQKTWEVNLMAHVYAARAVLPGMLERGEGYLLNTASAAGLLSQIGSATYSVTKHAAVAFAEWLSITYGDRGIRVSVLCPQAVRTAMTAGNEDGVASVDGMLEPEQVADEVVRALEEERFLVLPHPQVLEYARRKTADYDRWLSGMRRLRQRYES